MTPQEAANITSVLIAQLTTPNLQDAVVCTLKDYGQQIHEEFATKSGPDGEAWAEWSQGYAAKVAKEGMLRRRRGGTEIVTFDNLPYEVLFEGHSKSHTILLRTGVMYAAALNMVHSARVDDTGFDLPDDATALPEYAARQNDERPFLGMGDQLLDKSLEHGLDSLMKQTIGG